MKLKSILSFIFIAMPMLLMAQVIEINDIRFPDDNFRIYLIMQYGEYHVFTDEEIEALTTLRVNDCDIESLEGVGCFTALKQLYCSSNKLTFLDLSHNTALTQVFCDENQLTSLEVSQNSALTFLSCSSNRLASLDVSYNTALRTLNCTSNLLASLDVSQNVSLTSLNCASNLLTSLDLSQNKELEYLYCHGNKFASLDLSHNEALSELHCFSNQLTSLLVPDNSALNFIQCYSNQLSGDAMDAFIESLPQNTSETDKNIYVRDEKDAAEGNVCTKAQVAAILAKGWTPFCYSLESEKWVVYEGTDDDGGGNEGEGGDDGGDDDVQGISIDSTNFPDENFRNSLLEQSFGDDGVITENEIRQILMINVDGKNIASLQGVEFFTALVHLSCDNNLLTSLDVSHNTALMYLSCHSNQISGEAMDALIEGLPHNTSVESEFRFCIYDETDDAEGNECTSEQVEAIKAKGWTPCYFDGKQWRECGTEDDTPDCIALPTIEHLDGNIPAYNLAGQRVDNLQGKRGVYIVGGRKVMMK